MIPATPARLARRGAVSASTIFAIALAIIAGLIFAYLFRQYIFGAKKPIERPIDTSREIVVAAVNIYDKTTITSAHVKRVRKSPQEIDGLRASRGKEPLTGNQPVNRVTKKPIIAEMPIFEDDLEPFAYPASISEKLAPGKQAVHIEVAARDAMVQVGEIVDVHVTMSNDAFGGGNATALIARKAKVIARFGTTRPGAQPVNRDAPRPYALEVSPYRFALIELAKKSGAQFSLAVNNVPPESGDTAAASSEDADPLTNVVTPADLAALFNIGPAGPPPPPPFTLERINGLTPVGGQAFPGYAPRRSVGGGSASPASTLPLGGSGGVVPASDNRRSAAPPARPAFNPSTAVAARGNFGFSSTTTASASCKGAG